MDECEAHDDWRDYDELVDGFIVGWMAAHLRVRTDQVIVTHSCVGYSLTRLCLEGFLLNILKERVMDHAPAGSPSSAQPVPPASGARFPQLL